MDFKQINPAYSGLFRLIPAYFRLIPVPLFYLMDLNPTDGQAQLRADVNGQMDLIDLMRQLQKSNLALFCAFTNLCSFA